LFASGGIREGGAVIAVHPGASCPSKRWSAERFAQAADRIAERYDARVVIIASEKDRVFGDKVASLMKRPPLNLSGKTSVADLASVLKRARLFISNDSGPVHIACAVGTPVVDIFGRNDRGLSPRRWGPTGANDIVLHKEVGCEVCLAHNCKLGFKCLDAITVDEVVGAAEKILGT
ncbi:MAG: glycosyltransferase family 9 protein, partial [Candidatus Omnitrophica bacterium]|nr:glycosyltransferase family 9 protein [Candidatus Omnitrophota bacterium]